MLVLSRKLDEVIFIGDVKVMVVEIRGDKVRLGIEAPPDVPVDREEVRNAKARSRSQKDGRVGGVIGSRKG